MSEVKVIIQGRLEFTNQSSYEKAWRMYEHRIENFYKNDLFISDEMFNADQLAIIIPRVVAIGTTRQWSNTVRLLEYLSQFSVSGWIGAWQVEKGVVLKYAEIEPKGDKAVIKSFLKGRQLAEEKGKEKEAIKSLNLAISQYDKHAQAYGWRGYVNFLLGNLEDAMYDFNKCLKIDSDIPSAYYWRAKVYSHRKEWDKAISDFETTTRKAIALQPIYWKSRKLKAECHMQKEEWAKAEKELKLFTTRKFSASDPNKEALQHAHYLHARVLLQLKQYEPALAAIDKALPLEEQDPEVPRGDLLTLRGLIRQETGENAKDDWDEAAALGSKKAEELLARHYAS